MWKKIFICSPRSPQRLAEESESAEADATLARRLILKRTSYFYERRSIS